MFHSFGQSKFHPLMHLHVEHDLKILLDNNKNNITLEFTLLLTLFVHAVQVLWMWEAVEEFVSQKFVGSHHSSTLG